MADNMNNVIISVKDLKKTFQKNEVLKGVSIDIFKGDVVCVIGASGSGKSTFLRCLNMLEVPTGGSIFFENNDLTDKNTDLNLHRQKMGMVFQQFNLFPHMTILENLTCAPMMLKKVSKEQAEEKAMNLLSQIDGRHILRRATLIPLLWAGILGMVRAAFHLGGFPHSGQNLRHQGRQFFFIHWLPPI